MKKLLLLDGNSLTYRGDGGGIRNHGLLVMTGHSAVVGCASR